MAYTAKKDISEKETMAQFVARGGKAEQVAEGVKAERVSQASAESIIARQYGDSLSDGAFLAAVERLKCERGF